jgi:hypothetical protein
MHGARGGAPEGKMNGNYRHGARTKVTIEIWLFINRYADVGFSLGNRSTVSGLSQPGRFSSAEVRSDTAWGVLASVRHWCL